MASIFSSLFGVGQQPQQQVPAAAVTTQQLPEEVAPYYEKLLKEAEALYKRRMEEGAPKYIDPVTGERGKTIAGFTPEHEQMFTGIKALAGTTAPKFAEAETLTRGTAEEITPEEVQEYMNPYQQAVTDIEKREAEKKYQTQVLQPLRAQAAATQPYGGSRQAIQEGMASEAQQRLLADIQARGSAEAYKDAMSNIQQQRQREGAAAAQLAGLAPAAYGARARELGAVGQVGDVKRQQTQLALDEAYKEFLQEQQFPGEALKQYQSTVQSFPNIPTQITRTPPPAQPSLATQLTGLGATALGTYGAFGGFSPEGFFGMKKGQTGGGIADLPIVYRQQSGQVFKYPEGTKIDPKTGKPFGPFQNLLRWIGGIKPVDSLGPTGLGLGGLYDDTDVTQLPDIDVTPKPVDNQWLYSKRSPSVLPDHQRVAYGPEGAYVITDSETGETVSSVPPPRELSDEELEKVGFISPVTEDKGDAGKEDTGQGDAPPPKSGEAPLTGLQKILAERREEIDKMKLPEGPDTKALEQSYADLAAAKEKRNVDLAARLSAVPEETKKQMWATLAKVGTGLATSTDPLLTGVTKAMGQFTEEGAPIHLASKKEMREIKEQQTENLISNLQDKTTQQQFLMGIKSDKEQKKFENIFKKIDAKDKINASELQFLQVKNSELQAKAALKRADAAIEANKIALAEQNKLDPYKVIDTKQLNNLAGNFNRVKEGGLKEDYSRNMIMAVAQKINSLIQDESAKVTVDEVKDIIDGIEIDYNKKDNKGHGKDLTDMQSSVSKTIQAFSNTTAYNDDVGLAHYLMEAVLRKRANI